MRFLKLVLLSFLLSSCASYSRKEFRNDLKKVSESNFETLNGKYESRPFHFYGDQFDWNMEDSLKTRLSLGIYEMLQNKSNPDENTEFLNYQSANLTFKRNGKLIYEIIRNDSIIKIDSVKYKINKGMIKLENSFYKCKGIPFLLGGCKNGRIRLGLSKNNNLIVNESYDQAGALLLVFWAGTNHNSTYEYRKVK